MNTKRFIFFTMATLMLFAASVFAQISDAQDTVVVPSDYVNNNGNTTGSLNKFIEDDKNDGGIPAGRVYKLKRGEYYLLSGTINIDGFTLRLIGEEGPSDTQPAVVSAGLKADGSGIWQFFKTKNDVEFRNIYFKGATPTDILTGECVRFIAPKTKFISDNCVFDSFHFVTIHFFKVSDCSAFITNSYFRNLNHKTGGKYNGRGLRFFQATHVDTVVMVNNTFVNSNSFFLDINRFTIVDYARIDHNTIANTVKFVFQWHWQTNAVFTNNLFYNGHSYGETDADAANQDPDGLVFGIFGIDTIGVDSLGIVESERNVQLTNNCWFYDSKVQAYWNSRDSVHAEPFLNSRSQAMFDDDATWPGLIEKDNINSEPHFTKFPEEVTDAMVKYMEGDRDGTEKENNWGNYPDRPTQGYVWRVYWPIKSIEDLSYATTDAAYTGGTDGFPIGDLNWFPDKKDEWITDVDDNAIISIPEEYSLSQNYPNPFNPSTVISFNLPKQSVVSLKVFNILGEEVATLVNNKMIGAGVHNVNFNAANLPSGVYIYKISAGNYSASKKMMLLK
jgi:hypothetical protein